MEYTWRRKILQLLKAWVYLIAQYYKWQLKKCAGKRGITASTILICPVSNGL